ncbi:tol-pal system protein YbgF [Endothiovibrio diazotrophicus]
MQRPHLIPWLALALLCAAPAAEATVKEDYSRSMALYRNGQFERARSAFEHFLARHPGTAYSDNARYWIGETYYSQGDYRTALTAFRQVVTHHPDEPKAPDALFKIALCNRKLGRSEGYRNTLIGLRARYPQTAVSIRAERRLAAIGGSNLPVSRPLLAAPPPQRIDDRLVASLPPPPTRETLQRLHRYLETERETLRREANEELTTGEVLFAVVAPGGLLYLAHRHQEKERAAEELKRIDQDFALVEDEQAALARRPTLVADLGR